MLVSSAYIISSALDIVSVSCFVGSCVDIFAGASPSVAVVSGFVFLAMYVRSWFVCISSLCWVL